MHNAGVLGSTWPEFFQVNAFSATGYDGNPAGVCLVDDEFDDAKWMQTIAKQVNASETAFLREDGPDRYSIRWFSPAKEMFLCGHATLAAAHVLRETGRSLGSRIEFQGIEESLAASIVRDGIELDFPKIDREPCPLPEWFEPAFRTQAISFFRGRGKYLAIVHSDSEVCKLAPDFGLLRKVADRGVIVSARSSNKEFDVISRYFAAYVGVEEDPVTGAAHCCLGPYWAEVLGKSEIRAFQASPRGGQLLVRVQGSRVYLTGKARTVLAGKLMM